MADYISRYETGAAVDAALDLAMSALQPESGKGLSTNDFTNEYKDKVDSNDAEISSARGSYTTVNDRLNDIESEQESQGAALVELVDGGAKNQFNIDDISSAVTYNASYSVTGNSIHAEATGRYGRVSIPFTFKAGNNVFSCAANNLQILGGDVKLRFSAKSDGTSAIAPPTTIKADGSFSTSINVDNDTTGYIVLYMNTDASSYTNSADFFNIMICTKAAWDISHQYVPYRPSYDDLISRIEALEAGT